MMVNGVVGTCLHRAASDASSVHLIKGVGNSYQDKWICIVKVSAAPQNALLEPKPTLGLPSRGY